MEFDSIVKAFLDRPHVTAGKMMSAPGLKYKDKVFSYHFKGKMGFKLGKGFDIESEGIPEYNLLSPFKKKPPLAAWFEVKDSYSDHWPKLTELALRQIKSDFGDL